MGNSTRGLQVANEARAKAREFLVGKYGADILKEPDLGLGDTVYADYRRIPSAGVGPLTVVEVMGREVRVRRQEAGVKLMVLPKDAVRRKQF